MSKVRLVPIVVIAALTLAILLGAWQTYRHFRLFEPLKSSLLSVQGVKSVDFAGTGNNGAIEVNLGPISALQDGDLQETYDTISSRVQNTAGTGSTFGVVDHHNELLTEAYEMNFQPIVSQGVTQGNYTTMIQQFDKEAASERINGRISMDDHNIYIQLSKGNYYLYRIMPYSLHGGGGTS